MSYATAPAAARTEPVTLREWIRDHDEKWLFVGLYLGLAVVLSVLISLFWLVVVAALHFAFECYRQAHYRSGATDVTLHALWEIKLDVGLVLLSLTLVLYIDVVMGLLGIQSAARAAAATRASARIASRAAAWERNLRTFLLTIDEMFRVSNAAAMFYRRKVRGGPAPVPEPAAAVEPAGAATGPAWRRRWGLGDRVGVVLVAGGVVLLVAAPYVTSLDWGSALELLREELRPFPG